MDDITYFRLKKSRLARLTKKFFASQKNAAATTSSKGSFLW
jgi:hypothetical protein